MIDWILIGFGISICSLYYVFYKISKHCQSNVLLIENNINDTEIPPSYEEAVQNRE
jgi:hypothetical protein